MKIALDARGAATRVRALLIALALSLAVLLASSPALAHQDHKKKQAEAALLAKQKAETAAASTTMTSTPVPPQVTANEMMDNMDMGMDRSKMSFFERMVDWFGRLHPMIVHFPIAFFPAALFTAVVGRKRPAFSAPVQFLVVAGGILAPLAAAAGWLAGMGADPEPVLAYHRWLGVAIGLAGAGLGIWAWKRPWEDRGAGMIAALAVMTIAIAVQGFMGAAVTHGMEHMMF